MSAVLSPAEQQEVTRFGLFDEEILRDIAEHAGDGIACERCEGPADMRAWLTCCNDSEMRCTRCHVKWLARLKTLLAFNFARCSSCKTVFPPRSDLTLMVRTVAL